MAFLENVIGALFIGFIMMPGSIYLGLIAGRDGASRRMGHDHPVHGDRAPLLPNPQKQELYLLYYIGASLTANVAGMA
jgi:hypothetical protein